MLPLKQLVQVMLVEDLQLVARAVVAVVVAVAAAVDAALHHGLARYHEVGGAFGLRAHVAAHVVAGHDVAVVAASHVDTARVLDVGPAAAAVEVVGDNLRVGVSGYHGADLVGYREEGASYLRNKIDKINIKKPLLKRFLVY